PALPLSYAGSVGLPRLPGRAGDGIFTRRLAREKSPFAETSIATVTVLELTQQIVDPVVLFHSRRHRLGQSALFHLFRRFIGRLGFNGGGDRRRRLRSGGQRWLHLRGETQDPARVTVFRTQRQCRERRGTTAGKTG